MILSGLSRIVILKNFQENAECRTAPHLHPIQRL